MSSFIKQKDTPLLIRLARNTQQTQVFYAITDQGVVSLGNFLTNIFLARSLPPEQYGVYAVLFAFMLFLNGFHFAFVIYPLTIKGATTDRASLHPLVIGSLLLTLCLVLPLTVTLCGATWSVANIGLTPWVATALLFWQAQETARRAIMTSLSYQNAIWGDAVSYLGQAVLIWSIIHVGDISLESVFLVMSLSSAIALLLQLGQLRLRFSLGGELFAIARNFWKLGRVVFISSLMGGLTTLVPSWTLAIFRGAGEAAALQSMANILGVTHPVMISMGNLLLPAVARARFERGSRAAQKVAWVYAAQGAVLIGPYFAAILFWPKEALSLFYGSGSPYLGLAAVFGPLILAYALTYVSVILKSILNGFEENWADFMAQVVCTLSIVLLAVPLVIWGGVAGAMWAAVVAISARVLLSLIFIKKRL